MNEFRYDERLKTKAEESTRLVYTGLKKVLTEDPPNEKKGLKLDFQGNS
jgi:hypothetical protein